MGTYNQTEDIEFLTDIDTGGNVVRRGRFIQRPRRVNGRNVPGNARYYRRRQNELLAGRRAAQRGAAGAARTATNTARPAAPRRPAAPSAGQRRSGGGIFSRVRRAVRNAARNVEARQRDRRNSRNRR